MAVTIDGTPTKGSWASGLTITVSHTPSASATHLLVMVGYIPNALDTITGVTFNGVAMTHITPDSDGSGGSKRVSFWKLASPASGAHNVVVTFDANDSLVAHVIVMSVAGSASITAATTNTAASGQPSVTITGGGTGGDMAVGAVLSTDSTTASGQTNVEAITASGYTFNVERSSATGALTWTNEGADEFVAEGVNIVSAGAVVTLVGRTVLDDIEV